MANATQPRAEFHEMTAGTQEDWQRIGASFGPFAQELPDRMFAHLRALGGDYGGYAVDRFQHSLQTATRAHRDGRDEEYVTCALLHDIGDLARSLQSRRDRGLDAQAVHLASRTTGCSSITASSKATISSTISGSTGTCVTGSASITSGTPTRSGSATRTIRIRSIPEYDTLPLDDVRTDGPPRARRRRSGRSTSQKPER